MLKVEAAPGGVPNRTQLGEYGPLLTVRIGFGSIVQPSHGGIEVPERECLGLLDTGATFSCIDNEFAKMMDIPLAGAGLAYGADGEMQSNVYLARMEIPELEIAKQGRFTGVDLSHGNSPARALVGRDFLDHLITTYDGPAGSVTVSRPSSYSQG